ncbi:MAG TPA: hypothetical protein VF395_10075, partial [Polyangiaceae bacterium]
MGSAGSRVRRPPVELALALESASKAGEWTLVGQLARELEARRGARSDVVNLDVERARAEAIGLKM